MKVITAFDSFKGCMSAKDACLAAAEGILQTYPDAEVVCLPMSDGGEGMVECVTEALGLEKVPIIVSGPLRDKVLAHYSVAYTKCDNEPLKGLKTAFMEMAAASGLTLVPEDQRNPMLTTTYGVGEMILDAIKRGCQKIVMGIGGSATCDGGKGMIDCLRPYLPLSVEIVVASDVSNPLYGPDGAAYIFGPQKGATPEQVEILDLRLKDFAHETEALGYATPELSYASGAGAAGGLGYGLMAYLNAELTSGIDLLLDIIGFDEKIKEADIVLTGEGKTDSQTVYGCEESGMKNEDLGARPKKVPTGVLARAKNASVKTILLSGCIEDTEKLLAAGFSEIHSINQSDTRELSVLMQREVAMENMRKTCARLTFDKA